MSARPVQKRRGMVPLAHGRNATSRTLSKSVIWRLEFQNRAGGRNWSLRGGDTVAVLRCIGATGSQVLAIYVAQAAIMGLAGAGIGTAIGVAISPGNMQLTRMPKGAFCNAICSVNAITPALVAL